MLVGGIGGIPPFAFHLNLAETAIIVPPVIISSAKIVQPVIMSSTKHRFSLGHLLFCIPAHLFSISLALNVKPPWLIISVNVEERG